MKSLNLQCDQGHGFELYVKSEESFSDQQARGLVTCPYCDSSKVERTLTAPTVRGGKGRGRHADEARKVPVTSPPKDVPSQAELEKAYKYLSEVRSKVEETHENVGTKFADKARAMHYGEIKEKGIYGEASPTQVKDLIDEGVTVAPLPNIPKGRN